MVATLHYSIIMKQRFRLPDKQKFIEEMKARQRNIVWPDALKNSRSADEFLIKGSAKPTLVQRIAAWLFGISFMGLGLFFLALALHEHAWPLGVLTVGFCALGIKIFSNGCTERKADPKE